MNTTKRRLAGIILIVVLLACAIGACLLSAFKSNLDSYALQGSGTENDPYVISSVDELKAFRDDVNGGNAYAGKYVKLTADVDLQCKQFEPIGNTSAKAFKGIFDGGSHTVKNFYLKKGVSVETAAGFFGYVTNGQVKNINFDNLYIYFYSNAGTAATSNKAAGAIQVIYGGGVAGYADNSQISGISVIGGVDVIGGNAGNGYASTSTSVNYGGRGGEAYAGGIVGDLCNGSRVSDCSFTGNVYGYGGYGGAGGAPSSGAGGAGGAGGNVYVAGIAAAALKNTEIERCYANAEFLVRAGNGGNGGNGTGSTPSYTGGKAGAGGLVRGGGIVGAMRGTRISDCFATGNMNLWNPVNGVPGSNFTHTTNTAANSTSNALSAGGIAGIINPETYTTTTTVVENVYSQVNVTEYYDCYFVPDTSKSVVTETNTRMGGIAGIINTPNVKLKNTYTLAATYSGESGLKRADGTTILGTNGATMSPVATYDVINTSVTATQVKNSVETLAEDIYYVEPTRYYENTASPKPKFNLVSAQVEEFGGTFNFDQDVWTGTSGLPVLKGVPLNERPSFTFEINTAADLTAVAKKINTGFVRFDTTININADIDLGGTEWIGLGTEFTFSTYELTINGNGHKISNLYSTKTTDNKGFINYARILHVKDLTIEDPVISGKGGSNAGALAGFVQYYGTFENCHSVMSGKMSAQNSIVRGKTSAGGLIGGVQSFAHRTSFLNCSSTINVNVAATAANTYFSAGGLIGLSCGGTVKNCYSTGNVIGDVYSGGWTYYIGAFIGQVSRQAIIENCFATGNVQCGTEASFIGCVNTLARGTTLKNCVYTGEVKYTYAPNSSTYLRYGGLISRCNSLNTQFINNVVLTPKVTFHADSDKTNNRRFGTLLCATGISKNLANCTTSATSYPSVKNTAVYTNNYTIATNWTKTHHTSTLDDYFINSSAKTTVVSAANIHSESFWVNTIGFDFNDVWEWNENLEGGLPTLKDNKFNVAGMGNDAILINDKNDLNTFRNLVNAGTSFEKKTVRMTADIDLGGTAWTPIGKDTATTFKGTFDGDGHIVYNLNVNKASSYKGFFVYLRDGAVVENLTLINPVIVNNAYTNTGAVVGGMENASIINCHVKGGSITSGAGNLGGIVGYILGTQPARVAECSVTSLNPTTGYTSPISGKSNTGGIVGYINMTATLAATIEDCYCTRPVVCVDAVYAIGGIVGAAHGAIIRRCYSSNTVAASRGSNVGGIVGTVDTYKCEIYDCFSTGTIYAVGDYKTDTSSVYGVAGGIVGRNNINGTKIERCYALGEVLAAVQATPASGVTNNSRASAGGILGYTYSSSASTTVTTTINANISFSPVITAGISLNGHNQSTSRVGVTDSYTSASISSTKANYYLDGAYMSPSVIKKSTNCLRWDHLTSAKSAEALREESLYSGIGWNMDDVWEMQDGVNDGLPYLKSLGVPVYETGSVYNPIQINDKDEFKAFANNVNSGINYDGQYVELNCNVDMTGIGRIGSGYKYSFSGHFDGKGHKLTNFSLNIAVDNAAVFAYVTNATIKNLIVDKPTVKQTGTAKGSVGGLVGYSLCNLTIENCAVTGGTVTGQGLNVGGLVGCANHGYNRITGCFATAKVTGGSRVGGLIGLLRNGKAERCYAVSDVTGNLTSDYASGGLIGRHDYGGSIQNCYAKGTVSDSSTTVTSAAGGIVGLTDSYAVTINNCYFSGTLTAKTTTSTSGKGAYCGGIVGHSLIKGTVTNCAVLTTSMSATAANTTNARWGYITNSNTANAPTMVNNLRLDTISTTPVKGSTNVSQNTSTATPEASFKSADLSVNKFSTTLAWDFDEIWTQIAGANDDLPMLTGLPTDVSDLESLLAAAKGYKEEDWNATTFAVLTEAIAEVEENITSINSDNKAYYLILLSDAIDGLRPEKTSLQSLYDDITENKEPYKEWYTNFAAMDSALAQAKTILEEDSNQYKNKDVISALATLIMANDNLQVDKTRLNEAIKKCSGVVESDYQPAEWAILQGELKNAVKVFGNANATAFEVKTATEALEAAIAGLKADKANLEKKISAAYSALGGEVSFEDGVMTVEKLPTLTAEKFEKFDTFENALSVAEEVYANADALTSEVISSAYDLGVALNNLVLDRTELRDEYNLAGLKKESQFTPESWEAFKTAVDNAGEVLQKPDASPENFVEFSTEIDEALAALKLAADGLAIDKAQLEALIALAKEELKNSEIYVDDSLDALEQALEEAEAVYEDDEATGLEISAAAAKLNDAIKNLEINLDFLKKKLKEAESYLAEKDKEYYSDDSMTALQTAYDAAVIYGGPDAEPVTADDLDAVKEATRNLNEALDGMQANVERLRELITRAEEFDDDKYSEDSVNALKALAAANKEMLEGEYTDDEVIKGLKDLDYAFANLRADKSALIELVEEVSSWVNVKYRKDENGDWIVDENGNLKVFVVYSSESWDNLQAVLSAADSIVNKPNATVDEVDEAYMNLLQAIEDLEIDLSELKDRIKQANNILANAAVYTEETRGALTDARDGAQNAVDTVASLTLQDVQAVLDNLVAAIEGLEVDLTELNNLIDICEQQEERKYCFTDVTYSNMAAQAAFVKSILESDSKLTVQEYTDYVNLLTQVLQNLEVDTSALEEAIETAEGLEAEFITAATYAAVQSAVLSAEALLNSGNLTDADYEVKLASVTDYVNYLEALNGALEGIKPDLVAFASFINEKNALTTQAYSEETLDELKAAISNANTDLASADIVLTYDDGMAHVEAIRSAIEKLVPDTSALAEKVEQIVGEMNTEHTAPLPDGEEAVSDPLYIGKDMFTYEYYTADSYRALTDVIDEVNDFLKNPEGKTIEDVADMYDKLIAAYDGLVIDKSALRALLDECSSLNGDYYSADSYQALESAMENAESAYDDETITLADYAAAYNQLAEARSNLAYDTASLNALIERAEAIIAATKKEDGEEGKLYYTADSLDALKDALEEAKLFDPEAAGNSEEASEAISSLADLCKALSEAIDNLIDLSALRDKIAEAEAKDNSAGTYPAGAFAALQTGIAEAKEVYANAEATAEEVSEQIEKLEKLIEALTAGGNTFIVKSENTFYNLVDGKSNVLDQNARTYDAENPAYLVNVALNDSVEDIISQFTNTGIRAFMADGVTEITDLANTKIATGIILRLYAGTDIADEITVVLKCDVNGDGKVNAVDKAQINGYFLGTKTLEGANMLACDINGDGKINAIDKAQINSYFLGNKNIYAGLSVKE